MDFDIEILYGADKFDDIKYIIVLDEIILDTNNYIDYENIKMKNSKFTPFLNIINSNNIKNCDISFIKIFYCSSYQEKFIHIFGNNHNLNCEPIIKALNNNYFFDII